LKNKFTILGCGSSLGSPWITNYKSKLKQTKKNIRSRCCAHIKYKDLSILIDTSPDIKQQIIKNKIRSIDAILYSHEHADQTSGIFELKPFSWINKKKIPVFGTNRTIKLLKKNYKYCFYKVKKYKPFLSSNIIKNRFIIRKEKNILPISVIDVTHGDIPSSAYIIEKLAYLSDCNKIPNKSLKYFFNLNFLIIDCLKNKKHPSHFNYNDVMRLIKILKPKKTILTNLSLDMDYSLLKKKLPKNIIPAHDGLSFNF
jgi:phosphoribosyl 1,2-cyclic phosphate phosphodiesterase|tara:strand:+ start:1541 stop:2308 length:768 start_codon:yes stop_codon:yes gene_type:complete